MIRTIRAAALAAALAGLSGAALADECTDMTGTVKTLIDKISPDKAENDAARCAVYSEGLGLMRVFRIVTDECLPDGDKRIASLADLDRAIRNLQGQIDRKCQ